jgi:zinc transport system substrate-binding protein
MMRRAIATLILTLPALAACGTSSSTSFDESFVVSVSLYPIAEIVQRVGGDSIEVMNLTPPGTDAHDVELTAKQLLWLEKSDVVFYFGDDFQPSAQKAIESLSTNTVIDLFDSVELLEAKLDNHDHEHSEEEVTASEEEHSHGEHDPHVWLDPANMIAMTKTVEASLAKAQPDNAETFAANSAAYIAELTEIGNLLDSTIGPLPGQDISRCDEDHLYTAHQGFTYLAHRAGLTLVPIAGINPDEQVSAQYLEEITAELDGTDVTIFYESLITSSAAEALAKAVQVKTDVLNPIEGPSQSEINKGLTYISAQRENIQKIAKGLRCS